MKNVLIVLAIALGFLACTTEEKVERIAISTQFIDKGEKEEFVKRLQSFGFSHLDIKDGQVDEKCVVLLEANFETPAVKSIFKAPNSFTMVKLINLGEFFSKHPFLFQTGIVELPMDMESKQKGYFGVDDLKVVLDELDKYRIYEDESFKFVFDEEDDILTFMLYEEEDVIDFSPYMSSLNFEKPDPDEYGNAIEMINIGMDGEGKSLLAELTQELEGSIIAVFCNEKLVSAPLIYHPITEGEIQFSGPGILTPFLEALLFNDLKGGIIDVKTIE